MPKKNINYKKNTPNTGKGRIKHHIPAEKQLFKGNGYVRYKKLKAMGIKRDEAERLAHDVRECNKIFGKVKHDRTQEIKGLVKVEEGTGPNQVDVNGIFQFERQRDILRRILAQGVPLDEAIPLAREAGESQEPFDRALAKRFVREQLSDIRSSSDEITVTGGARKRFRILVSKGVHIDKARIVCQCPVKTRQLRFALSGTIIEPTPKAPKRPVRAANTKSSPANFRSSGTGNTSNSNIAYEQSQNALRDNKSHPQQININETQCKNTRHIEPQISTSIRYRQETPFLGTMIEPHTNDDPLRIKLAVISPDFPLTIWPTEMLKGIQHFISKAADNEGIDLTSLYASCSFRPGWIAYSITDMRTAQWFRTRVPHLRPYEAFLAVVDQDAVPRSQIFVGYIPEQRNLSNDDLLEAIGMKNNGLRTRDWNVINRTQRGSILELLVLIDPFSVKALQVNNYSIKYGHSSACLKPRQSLGVPSFRESTQPYSTSSSNVILSTKEDERKNSHRREYDRNESVDFSSRRDQHRNDSNDRKSSHRREYDRNESVDFSSRRDQHRNDGNDRKSSHRREYNRNEIRDFPRRSEKSKNDSRNSNSYWRSM